MNLSDGEPAGNRQHVDSVAARKLLFSSSVDQQQVRPLDEGGDLYRPNRLSRASGVPEPTLQQYAQSRADLPPRADILFKLARAANVSLEWRRARVR